MNLSKSLRSVKFNREYITELYRESCQKIGAMLVAPSARQIQLMLFAVGVTVLVSGLSLDSFAQQKYKARAN